MAIRYDDDCGLFESSSRKTIYYMGFMVIEPFKHIRIVTIMIRERGGERDSCMAFKGKLH